MLMSPDASKALVPQHVLLRPTFVLVVLASHWIYKKGKKATTEFARVEKCKGTGAVANVDVFKAKTLDWYLKPRSEVDASGRAKDNRN